MKTCNWMNEGVETAYPSKSTKMFILFRQLTNQNRAGKGTSEWGVTYWYIHHPVAADHKPL
jgi:hypothetical protein